MPTKIARHAGTVAALGFVLIFFLLAVAFSGCATQKALPHYTPEQQAAQRASIGYWQPDPAKPDSSTGPRMEPGSQADLIRKIFEGHPPVVQQDIPGDVIAQDDSLRFVKVVPAKRRLFGLLPAKKVVSSPKNVASDNVSGSKLPRKCKGCQITIQNGNGNTSGQASTDKKGQTLGAGATNTQTGKKSGDIIKADSGATVYHAESKKGPAAAGKGISQTEQKPGFPWWIVLVGAGLYVGYKKFIA